MSRDLAGEIHKMITKRDLRKAASVVYNGSSGTFINYASVHLSNLASVAINTSLVSDTDITDDLGSMAVRWKDIFAQTAGTGDTAGDIFKLRARDIDGTAWIDFITLTAGNTPTCDLSDSVTKSSGYIYRGGGTDVAVADGGTNLSTIAAGSVLAANSIDVLSAITSDTGVNFLMNDTGTVSWNSATGAGNVVLVTPAAADDGKYLKYTHATTSYSFDAPAGSGTSSIWGGL